MPFSFRYSHSIIKPEQYWESSKIYGKDNLWAEFWIIDTKLSSGKHFAGWIGQTVFTKWFPPKQNNSKSFAKNISKIDFLQSPLRPPGYVFQFNIIKRLSMCYVVMDFHIYVQYCAKDLTSIQNIGLLNNCYLGKSKTELWQFRTGLSAAPRL